MGENREGDQILDPKWHRVATVIAHPPSTCTLMHKLWICLTGTLQRIGHKLPPFFSFRWDTRLPPCDTLDPELSTVSSRLYLDSGVSLNTNRSRGGVLPTLVCPSLSLRGVVDFQRDRRSSCGGIPSGKIKKKMKVGRYFVRV